MEHDLNYIFEDPKNKDVNFVKKIKSGIGLKGKLFVSQHEDRWIVYEGSKNWATERGDFVSFDLPESARWFADHAQDWKPKESHPEKKPISEQAKYEADRASRGTDLVGGTGVLRYSGIIEKI